MKLMHPAISPPRGSFEHEILPHVDCVILGPGPGTPHRQSDFSWPTRLLEQVGHRVPIFGLCLGCQGLATVHGGSVSPLVALSRICHPHRT